MTGRGKDTVGSAVKHGEVMHFQLHDGDDGERVAECSCGNWMGIGKRSDPHVDAKLATRWSDHLRVAHPDYV